MSDSPTYAVQLADGTSTTVDGHAQTPVPVVVVQGAPLGGKLGANLDGNGYAITNFQNAGSAASLAVTAGGAQSFPATTLDCAALGLVNGHTYSATLGWRVRQWKDDKSAAGSTDLVEDVLITVAAGVATVVFNRTPVPDPRGLVGTALSAGTASVAASTGGFTVSVTRGAAVNCHASWRMWCNNFEDLG